MTAPLKSISTARAFRTREKMFKATEQILSLEGYAAWNEEYLCQLCECSRGALRYQFPEGRYDLFPSFIEAVIEKDSRIVEAMGELAAVERMYLFLMSMRVRPPSPATRAILEISMASRGDAKLLARIEPIMDSANARVLGMAAGETDPELLALRCLLHGVTMYCFQKDYTAHGLSRLIGWILAQLPVPPELAARAAQMTAVRQSAGRGADSGE